MLPCGRIQSNIHAVHVYLTTNGFLHDVYEIVEAGVQSSRAICCFLIVTYNEVNVVT